jgi:drug/metabolite transporter (DMT)-like permease
VSCEVRLDRITSVVAGAAFLVLAAITALVTLYIGAITCDESCSDEPGVRWPEDSGAWQWDLVVGLAAAGFLLALACVAARAASKRRTAQILALAYAATAIVAAALLDQAGDSFALIGAAPAVACAIVMTRPPRVTDAA